MRNDDPLAGSTRDSYAVVSQLFVDVTPEPVLNVKPPVLFIDEWVLDISVGLTDNDASVFGDAFIPAQLPSLSRFEFTNFSMRLTALYVDVNGDDGPPLTFEANGRIVALPEPSSAILVGLGLVGLALRRRF